MDEESKKILAYIAGLLYKVVTGQELTDNEVQSLENIASDLGCWDIQEKYFRYQEVAYGSDRKSRKL